MELFQGLNLIDGTELIAILLVCWAFNEGVKKSNIKNQYMSFISMGVGIMVGLLIALVFHDGELGKAGLVGLLMGGFTTGLFKDVKEILNQNQEDKL